MQSWKVLEVEILGNQNWDLLGSRVNVKGNWVAWRWSGFFFWTAYASFFFFSRGHKNSKRLKKKNIYACLQLWRRECQMPFLCHFSILLSMAKHWRSYGCTQFIFILLYVLLKRAGKGSDLSGDFCIKHSWQTTKKLKKKK